MILDFQKRCYLVTLPLTIQKKILNTTIEYIVSSKRFEVPLFDCFRYLCMAVLFTPYYFHFLTLSIFYFFKIFLFFIGLFPIIIDLVFNLFIM